MSKDCGNHGMHCNSHWHWQWHWQWHKTYRLLLACLIVLIILVLLAVFITWLALRPSKPSFYIQDASVTQFNRTAFASQFLLTTVLQVTLSSRNPNDRIGFYYDPLVAFTQYKGQQITAATILPGGYQGAHCVTVWSPFLYGAAVPLPPYLADAIAQDESAGYFLIHIHIEGRLRWKIGPWISGQYNIHSNCPAFLTLDSTISNANSDATSSYSFHFQHIGGCSVDI